MQIHPMCEVFPLMGAVEFEALKADLLEHGQQHPILTWGPYLIDGRHRLRACEELEITPWEEAWPGEESEIGAFVLSTNLQRRHLSESQCAMLGARLLEYYTAAAKERQGTRTDLPANWREGSEEEGHDASDDAAAQVHVSARSVERAAKMIREAVPELISLIDTGKLTVSLGAEIVSETHVVQRRIAKKITQGWEPIHAVQDELPRLKSAHVSKNSGENEWYTPLEFITAARAVLGEIDFDPASSRIANETVQAKSFLTAADDALSVPWPKGRIYMNPPYATGLIEPFTEKFVEAIAEGSTGIVLVNNATETAWFQALAASARAICFPKGRVRFLDPQGNLGAPLQGQACLYAGPDVKAFKLHFGAFGFITEDNEGRI